MRIARYNNKVAAPILAQEGGLTVGYIITFFISVSASVVGYYICKWLDRYIHGDSLR